MVEPGFEPLENAASAANEVSEQDRFPPGSNPGQCSAPADRRKRFRRLLGTGRRQGVSRPSRER